MSIYFPFISTIDFHSFSISSTVFVDGFVIPPFPPSLQLPCLREPLHALHQLRHVAVRGEGQVHRLKRGWNKGDHILTKAGGFDTKVYKSREFNRNSWGFHPKVVDLMKTVGGLILSN